MIRFLSIRMLILLSICHAAPVFSGHPALVDMIHPARALPDALPVPRIALGISADTMDGFNLTLELENYSLMPPGAASVGELRNVEGHAHLYINSIKIQRVYGMYLHLPRRLFVDGLNKITVSLNDHEHQSWQLSSGEDVMATLLIDPRKPDFVKSHFTTSKLQ